MYVQLLGLVCCLFVQYTGADEPWYVERDDSSQENNKPRQMSAKELMRQAALEVKNDVDERPTVSYSVISGLGGKGKMGQRKSYVEVGTPTPRKHSRPFFFGDGDNVKYMRYVPTFFEEDTVRQITNRLRQIYNPEKLKFKPAPEGWPLPDIPEHYYLPPTKKPRSRPTLTGRPGLIFEEKGGKGKKMKRRNRRVRKERSVDFSDAEEDDSRPVQNMKKGLGQYWARRTWAPKTNQPLDPRSIKLKDDEPLVLKPAPPNWPQPTFPPKIPNVHKVPWQPQGRQQGYQIKARRPPGPNAYSFDFKNNADTTYHTLLPRRSRGTGSAFYTKKAINVGQFQQPRVTFASRYEFRQFQKNNIQTTYHTLLPRRPNMNYNKLYNLVCPELEGEIKKKKKKQTITFKTTVPFWKKYENPNLFAFWVKTTSKNTNGQMSTSWPAIVSKPFRQKDPEDTEEDELFALTYWHRRSKGLKPQVDPYMLAMKYEKEGKVIPTKPSPLRFTRRNRPPVYRGFFSIRQTTQMIKQV